jgi:hypothetical protein
MPKIETEGVPDTFVHAHTFRFTSPAMTDKYQIPNPCTSCHQDKSTTWAAEAMSQWSERSPWNQLFVQGIRSVRDCGAAALLW